MCDTAAGGPAAGAAVGICNRIIASTRSRPIQCSVGPVTTVGASASAGGAILGARTGSKSTSRPR
jgi:hypothetical protein